MVCVANAPATRRGPTSLKCLSGVWVQVADTVATVRGVQQGYVVCPPEERFLLLFTFLKKSRDKKVMVFFSSCMSVRFHDELFNYIDLPTTCIHGKKKQNARMSTYYDFCNAEVSSLHSPESEVMWTL